MNKVPVSILIPVKNEEANIVACLSAINWCDDIWVVDSQSQDATAKISIEHGAKVVQFAYKGAWPKKKNWALANLTFKYEWVFILDADEILPSEAEESIRKAILEAGDISGYWVNRRFMFMGKWLQHAYYPNWNLRLFRHSLGRYEKITGLDTASGDNEVHEHVLVEGKTGKLCFDMLHYAFPTVAVFVEKHNRYSNWEAIVAREVLGGKAGNSIQSNTVSRRRYLRRLSLLLPFRPLLRFLYVFIWQRGFLDGREGYFFARLHAEYEFMCVAKEYELRKREIGSKSSG